MLEDADLGDPAVADGVDVRAAQDELAAAAVQALAQQQRDAIVARQQVDALHRRQVLANDLARAHGPTPCNLVCPRWSREAWSGALGHRARDVTSTSAKITSSAPVDP